MGLDGRRSETACAQSMAVLAEGRCSWPSICTIHWQSACWVYRRTNDHGMARIRLALTTYAGFMILIVVLSLYLVVLCGT